MTAEALEEIAEPTARIDVLEEEIWRAERDLRAMVQALDAAPVVDQASGNITLASGQRMVAELGDARRISEERDGLRRGIARQRRHCAILRAERRRLGDRWPMGLAEIGDELGYPPATIKQWKRRGLLPAPAGSVSGAPFWWRPTVLEWAKACGRDRKVAGVRVVNAWDTIDLRRDRS